MTETKDMTRSQLLEEARQRGVEVGRSWGKERILTALEAAALLETSPTIIHPPEPEVSEALSEPDEPKLDEPASEESYPIVDEQRAELAARAASYGVFVPESWTEDEIQRLLDEIHDAEETVPSTPTAWWGSQDQGCPGGPGYPDVR